MHARIGERPGSTLVIKLEHSLLILKGKGSLSPLQLAEIFALVTSGEQSVGQYWPQPWANFASFSAPKVMWV